MLSMLMTRPQTYTILPSDWQLSLPFSSLEISECCSWLEREFSLSYSSLSPQDRVLSRSCLPWDACFFFGKLLVAVPVILVDSVPSAVLESHRGWWLLFYADLILCLLYF